ncbi:ThiF family adenylyltransferase [Oceanidesulfovibrio marinus]|uniref:ThiF family adenylyltransferase n=1 Tax=Oceanidesulfovibrio marinus TaxID=370038 RepID=A0A6P1ZEQ5_9BACT|nr:ThiF family adenylyltransferase [Oceanidesulfovibrio marinus]TVM30539.1 ThiF family adenylyltransferase [Oceanidesulfovibrio marinus]
MTKSYALSLTGVQHAQLKQLLFPGDGREAVAFALCGQYVGPHRHKLLMREIYPVSAGACFYRSHNRVTWSTEALVPILESAEEQGLAFVKFHSHPDWLPQFSAIDAKGDRELLPMIRGWIGSRDPVASAVMLPDGQLFGAVLSPDDAFVPLDVISVVGDDIHFWYPNSEANDPQGFCASHAQLFGKGTTERLRKLSIAVVGCSGSGSPTIEQLVRLGVGELVLVDDDALEERNINRVYNSTMVDARQGRMKVDVLAEAISRIGLGTRVRSVPLNIWSVEAVKAVAACDVVFGCVDSVDGRYLLNTLATYYILPYFDIGVRLIADSRGPSKGRIREVCGSVHYLQPGKSSLMSRGVFSMEQVQAAGLLRSDPEAHALQRKEGYIVGVEEHRPAVISVNTYASALAVNELLGRIHPYREEPNENYAWVEFSLSSMEYFLDNKRPVCEILQHKIGRGDVTPLLEQLELN